MKINRNNYEEFIMDYYDGKLNPGLVSELFLFLKDHPDIKKEFDSFENFSLVPDENIVFENKESLKKRDIISVGSIDSSSYELYFVADLENDLSGKEHNDLILFLEKNPHLSETYHLIKLSKLRPDENIVFENKENLKKKEIVSVGSIDSNNYENYFIASVEKELNLIENENLMKFLSQNEQLRKEYDLFKQTKLVPDTSIVFDRKTALKKFIITPSTRKKKLAYQYVSIAASILIIFGLFFLFEQNKGSDYTANSNINRIGMGWFDHAFVNTANNNNGEDTVKGTNPTVVTSKTLTASTFIKSLKPTHIKTIPVKNSNNEIIALRGSGNPIQINNDPLADNSLQPQNKSSESLTIKEFLITKFRKNINQTDENLEQPKDRITSWDIAQAGVAAINKIAINDLQLKRDASNPDNSYALIGKNFTISKNYNDK